jgi:hypothetical protein
VAHPLQHRTNEEEEAVDVLHKAADYALDTFVGECEARHTRQ